LNFHGDYINLSFIREGRISSQIIFDCRNKDKEKTHYHANLQLWKLIKDLAFTGSNIKKRQKIGRKECGKAASFWYFEKLLTSDEEIQETQVRESNRFGFKQNHWFNDITTTKALQMLRSTIAYGMFAARFANDHILWITYSATRSKLNWYQNRIHLCEKLFATKSRTDIDDRIKWLLRTLSEFLALRRKKFIKTNGKSPKMKTQLIHFYDVL